MSAAPCASSGNPDKLSICVSRRRWFNRIEKSLKPSRSSTSLAAAHISASTTSEVDPTASMSHW